MDEVYIRRFAYQISIKKNLYEKYILFIYILKSHTHTSISIEFPSFIFFTPPLSFQTLLSFYFKMSSSQNDKKSSDAEMVEASSQTPESTPSDNAPACVAGFLSFRGKMARCKAEKDLSTFAPSLRLRLLRLTLQPSILWFRLRKMRGNSPGRVFCVFRMPRPSLVVHLQLRLLLTIRRRSLNRCLRIQRERKSS